MSIEERVGLTHFSVNVSSGVGGSSVLLLQDENEITEEIAVIRLSESFEIFIA